MLRMGIKLCWMLRDDLSLRRKEFVAVLGWYPYMYGPCECGFSVVVGSELLMDFIFEHDGDIVFHLVKQTLPACSDPIVCLRIIFA